MPGHVEGSVGEVGGRGSQGYNVWSLGTRTGSLNFIQSVWEIIGEFKAGKYDQLGAFKKNPSGPDMMTKRSVVFWIESWNRNGH